MSLANVSFSTRSYSDQGSHGPKSVGQSQWTLAVPRHGGEGGLSARTQSRLLCKPMLAIEVGTPVQEPPANGGWFPGPFLDETFEAFEAFEGPRVEGGGE